MISTNIPMGPAPIFTSEITHDRNAAPPRHWNQWGCRWTTCPCPMGYQDPPWNKHVHTPSTHIYIVRLCEIVLLGVLSPVYSTLQCNTMSFGDLHINKPFLAGNPNRVRLACLVTLINMSCSYISRIWHRNGYSCTIWTKATKPSKYSTKA